MPWKVLLFSYKETEIALNTQQCGFLKTFCHIGACEHYYQFVCQLWCSWQSDILYFDYLMRLSHRQLCYLLGAIGKALSREATVSASASLQEWQQGVLRFDEASHSKFLNKLPIYKVRDSFLCVCDKFKKLVREYPSNPTSMQGLFS